MMLFESIEECVVTWLEDYGTDHLPTPDVMKVQMMRDMIMGHRK